MSAKVVEKPKNSGKWGVRICKDGGESYRRTASKAAAEKLAGLINIELVRVELGLTPKQAAPQPTLATYAALWLDTYIKPPMRSAGTYSKYRGLLDNHLLPALGRKRLESFRRATIRDALLAIYNGPGQPSQSLIEVMTAVLSGIFAMAVDSELIAANPVADIGRSLRLPREMKKEFTPFSGAEVERVLTAIEQHYPASYPLFLTLFMTGMRLGEAIALQWHDINFRTRQIRIERTASHQVVHTTTKTHAARMVDMNNSLTMALTALKAAADPAAAYCFEQGGQLPAQCSMLRWFSKAQQLAGVNRRRIHDIRHTYASRLLSAGESPVYVSRQLGHKNFQITVDTYTKWIPSEDGQPVSLLERPPK